MISRTQRTTRPAALLSISLLLSAGCARRHLAIESDPPGATVTLNDVEVGRTPVRVGFTFYGTYDVRIEKPGYEPLRTKASAGTPIYERPPIDFLTMMIPADINTQVRWTFVLQPSRESASSPAEFERDLIDRARAMARDDLPPPP